jgi:transcriptional regulator with XRE-family HTH domain
VCFVSNKGALALRKTGKAQRLIARKCGVTQPTVSLWCSGKKLPTYENRKTLRDAYGIDVDDWDRKPEMSPVIAPMSADIGSAA